MVHSDRARKAGKARKARSGDIGHREDGNDAETRRRELPMSPYQLPTLDTLGIFDILGILQHRVGIAHRCSGGDKPRPYDFQKTHLM